ncbi:uncharacterized protein ACIBXB_008084 [Morphnus guianensis]
MTPYKEGAGSRRESQSTRRFSSGAAGRRRHVGARRGSGSGRRRRPLGAAIFPAAGARHNPPSNTAHSPGGRRGKRRARYRSVSAVPAAEGDRPGETTVRRRADGREDGAGGRGGIAPARSYGGREALAPVCPLPGALAHAQYGGVRGTAAITRPEAERGGGRF